MKYLTWIVLVILLAVYGGFVLLFGFPGPVALGIHFIRITVTVAGLVIFVQMAPTIFKEVPPPRRDYAIASLNFFLLSLVCFSFWNEAGRIFGVDTSVFTSYVAGGFSIFAIIASVFAIMMPDTSGNRPKILALIIGALASVGLVFVAPLFR